LGFNLGNQLGAGILNEFVDASASAPVTVSVGGTAALGLVIDLSGAAPEFAITDASGLSITTLVSAPDVDMVASVGPLGLFIQNGHVQLDNGSAGQAAAWTVGLASTASHRYRIADLLSNSGAVQARAAGRFDVNLPV